MKQPMWDNEAVKAYESGQGVELVNEPHPHYEPVAVADNGVLNWIADKQFTHEAELYTAPQRTWVGLTDEERKDLCRSWSSPMDAIYATEAKLKDKNI